MGKNPILTKRQEQILGLIAQDRFLTSTFYFTGGTALSAFYLQHRESVDLDFFSTKRFDTQIMITQFKEWGETLGFELQSEFLGPLFKCFAVFKDGEKIKIDFSYHPYKQLEDGKNFNLLRIDSLLDIAVNKLLTVTQRNEVKDFVDLYFLLKKFTVWDLREGVRIKFNVDLEPFIIASDYIKIEGFEFLPKMYKELKLEELKEFFREEAKKLAGENVK
ncbi:MAG: nucleotidyl transferase AbiEii/AbiGii toxin family protein [Patescibacteria group bacterium]